MNFRVDTVVLVTDYGTEDSYAAALVGACLRAVPSARVEHGTHGVPPGDVLAGALHLRALAQAFPPGTVFCAVVDPGVGTDRGLIAVQCGALRCTAPDNGLVHWLWTGAAGGLRRAVRLAVPSGASSTFHGRDVLAPAAARLASGASLDGLGAPCAPPLSLAAARVVPGAGWWLGRVAVVDHFGNAVTTVHISDLGGDRVLGAAWEGGSTDRVVATYAEIRTGHPTTVAGAHREAAGASSPGVAVITGGSGHLELAADGRSAAGLAGLQAGDPVRILVDRRM